MPGVTSHLGLSQGGKLSNFSDSFFWASLSPCLDEECHCLPFSPWVRVGADTSPNLPLQPQLPAAALSLRGQTTK